MVYRRGRCEDEKALGTVFLKGRHVGGGWFVIEANEGSAGDEDGVNIAGGERNPRRQSFGGSGQNGGLDMSGKFHLRGLGLRDGFRLRPALDRRGRRRPIY